MSLTPKKVRQWLEVLVLPVGLICIIIYVTLNREFTYPAVAMFAIMIGAGTLVAGAWGGTAGQRKKDDDADWGEIQERENGDDSSLSDRSDTPDPPPPRNRGRSRPKSQGRNSERHQEVRVTRLPDCWAWHHWLVVLGLEDQPRSYP